MSLSRSKLEQICDDLYTRTQSLESCLKDAGIDIGSVGNLVLVGGMTEVQRLLNWQKNCAVKTLTKELIQTKWSRLEQLFKGLSYKAMSTMFCYLMLPH